MIVMIVVVMVKSMVRNVKVVQEVENKIVQIVLVKVKKNATNLMVMETTNVKTVTVKVV
jgi:hypothetical protein